ncbi:ETX/MTX2 family pore-forming toxin [Streptomyces sp. BBFR2]|uniref:ETX/MTX2 family pore-forming toxin n=1 Tax=Streptomyces sp. BBFR2 TaxID=3372854 RepID=UPI0037D9C90D
MRVAGPADDREERITVMVYSLQEITNAWGNWMATEKYPESGGYDYTASTNYDSQSSLSAYHQYQVTQKFLEIEYDPDAKPAPGELHTNDITYRNQTDAAQTVRYNYTSKTAKAFSMTTSKTLKTGVELSTEVEIPGVAKVGAKFTMNLELTKSETTTKTEEQTWSVDVPVVVPKQSQVHTWMTINTASYDVSYTASAQLENYVAIWFKNKVSLGHDGNNHWLWFVPIEWVFSDCVNNSIIDTAGYYVNSSGVVAQASGVFSGGQGVSVVVDSKQSPLKAPERAGAEVEVLKVGPRTRHTKDGKFPLGVNVE